jgi:hypothetical protein
MTHSIDENTDKGLDKSFFYCSGILFFPRNSVLFRASEWAHLRNLEFRRNEHFFPRNKGIRSKAIPRNFFGTKLSCQPYQRHLGGFFFSSSQARGTSNFSCSLIPETPRRISSSSQIIQEHSAFHAPDTRDRYQRYLCGFPAALR